MLFDPAKIPRAKIREAAGLAAGRRWAVKVPLARLPQMDGIVCGSVAVTARGRRCGKGEGYSDLEYAILLELGHRPVPVATTVHDIQVVNAFPRERTDLPLSAIVTPGKTILVRRPARSRSGIDWKKLQRRSSQRCRYSEMCGP